MIRGVIFDFDGVIADSEPVHFETFRQVLEVFGVKLEQKRWPEFEGTGADHIMATLFKENNIREDAKKWVEKRRELFLDYISRNKIPLKEGLLEFLEKLKQRKIKMAIASGSRTMVIEKILGQNNIRHYFEGVYGIDKVSKRKPDPEVFLLAMNNFSLRPSECIIIEDSISGITAAAKSKIKCVCMHSKITQGLKECAIIIKNYNEFPVEILDD